jgi:hypothetical protein
MMAPKAFGAKNKHRATERTIHHHLPAEKDIAVRASFQ